MLCYLLLYFTNLFEWEWSLFTKKLKNSFNSVIILPHLDLQERTLVLLLLLLLVPNFRFKQLFFKTRLEREREIERESGGCVWKNKVEGLIYNETWMNNAVIKQGSFQKEGNKNGNPHFFSFFFFFSLGQWVLFGLLNI